MQKLKNQIAEYADRVIANIITNRKNQQSVKVISGWKVGEMRMKDKPNKVTAVLKVIVTGEFYDDDSTEETLRYAVEQDLEDAGFDVDVALLKEQEVRELTIEEWYEWKINQKHDPICILWENDYTPMWILNPNDVHEPALLIGKLKLFNGKPTHEQCKAIKWN